MKLISIVGARPQFIKASILIAEFKKNDTCSHVLVHTGQHYDQNMSDIFFDELGINPPDYNLEVGSGRHGAQTGQMIEELEDVFLNEKPDWVIVYGDTNSTLAAAIAASKLHIPIAHVEAGLRSFNKTMPEEINRVLVDHLSSMLLVPTETAVNNLLREGFGEKDIHLVGDVMYDSVLHYKDIIKSDNSNEPYLLATVHRAENTDDKERLSNIFEMLIDLSKQISVIIPLHPRTRSALDNLGLISKIERYLTIKPPVSYLELLNYEKNARLIITDSGGIQKEAFFIKTPCVTLRNETEWVELMERGCNLLVPPTDKETMLKKINEYLENIDILLEKDVWSGLYGSGKACSKISSLLLN
tara:strand:- start:223355 stop:224428 length:1074 start_codon:yes stop_codon:yes gene_type:complete